MRYELTIALIFTLLGVVLADTAPVTAIGYGVLAILYIAEDIRKHPRGY